MTHVQAYSVDDSDWYKPSTGHTYMKMHIGMSNLIVSYIKLYNCKLLQKLMLYGLIAMFVVLITLL